MYINISYYVPLIQTIPIYNILQYNAWLGYLYFCEDYFIHTYLYSKGFLIT